MTSPGSNRHQVNITAQFEGGFLSFSPRAVFARVLAHTCAVFARVQAKCLLCLRHTLRAKTAGKTILSKGRKRVWKLDDEVTQKEK